LIVAAHPHNADNISQTYSCSMAAFLLNQCTFPLWPEAC